MLEAETEIAAPPEQVWELVSDLPRMASWSPQVVKTIVRGGEVRSGAKAININRSGWKLWPTQSKVIEFEPAKRLSFRVADNWLHWTYELTPTEAGTHVRLTRTAPDGLSPISAKLQGVMMGGLDKFDAEVQAGMETTLDRIKAELEK